MLTRDWRLVWRLIRLSATTRRWRYRVRHRDRPRARTAHHGLAALLSHNCRPAEAIKHFQIVLAHEPEHHALQHMAAALIATGCHAEGIALCRKAIAVRPNCALAMSVLGNGLAEVG